MNRMKRLKGLSLQAQRTLQEQPPRGVPRKRCSENMQQIYRRTPMLKCDFSKVVLQKLLFQRTPLCG